MTQTVGVVIPVFNATPYFDKAIQSVMAQTHQDFTCTIVDDGSTDDTVHRAQNLISGDRRFHIVRQLNSGVGAARNRGAVESRSEFMAFLDHDDVWDVRFLEVLTLVLSQQEDVPAAHCVAEGITASGELQGNFAEWSRQRVFALDGKLVPAAPGRTTFESLVTAPCIVSPGAGLIRRSFFERIGGYDSTLPLAEDWDVWIKLSRLGALDFVDDPLFYYRQHGKSMHVHNWKSRRSISRVRRSAISNSANTAHQTSYARQAARTFYRSQGQQLLHLNGMKPRLIGLARIAHACTF